MNPTQQQQAFVDAFLAGGRHLALRARAGCGKTSTIVLGVVAYCAANPQDEVLVVAYNKAIADEVADKLKAAGLTWRQAQGSTAHSIGWGLCRFALQLNNNAIDDKKVRKIIEARNEPIYVEYKNQIEHLVHLAKQDGCGFFPDFQVGDTGAWYRLAEHHDVNGLEDTSTMDDVIQSSQSVYRESLSMTRVVDFDDMILFPLIKNFKTKFTKDRVVLDEAQDTSRARQALVRKFLRPGGQMAVVGDDKQAIYGFAGADSAALPSIIEQLDAQVLPLSVTWRCPRAVVREAQKFVPDIEAAEGAAEGEVLDAADLPKDLRAGDAVLCRNVAPLVKAAYQLIRAGVPARVEGRAIGEGLLVIVNRWKVTTIAAFLNKLEDWREREVQKALAKGSEQKAADVGDRAETIKNICDAATLAGRTDLGAVRERVEVLFADGVSDAVVLCSAHRSKGREWKRVFLLHFRTLCPSRWARQQWQVEQEKNLMYVMITRAQETLVYVE